MLGTVMHGPRDVRFESRPDPVIEHPTDAIVRLSATCICGSDLWPYRGENPITAPLAMGHEYCGIVEAVGSAVRNVRPGQFVVGSFCISDNTCPHCRYGFQSSCAQREFMTGAQSPFARVPLADGTLVATDELPSDDLLPSLLAAIKAASPRVKLVIADAIPDDAPWEHNAYSLAFTFLHTHFMDRKFPSEEGWKALLEQAGFMDVTLSKPGLSGSRLIVGH